MDASLHPEAWQNLMVSALAHAPPPSTPCPPPFTKFQANLSSGFCVTADRRTDRQTHGTENKSSLAEVIMGKVRLDTQSVVVYRNTWAELNIYY